MLCKQVVQRLPTGTTRGSIPSHGASRPAIALLNEAPDRSAFKAGGIWRSGPRIFSPVAACEVERPPPDETVRKVVGLHQVHSAIGLRGGCHGPPSSQVRQYLILPLASRARCTSSRLVAAAEKLAILKAWEADGQALQRADSERHGGGEHSHLHSTSLESERLPNRRMAMHPPQRSRPNWKTS
jgi:hypothetical protein